ncbi:TIGR02301 family protein [Oryzibacter oryziterrae]|uniref:TIGR02301 family protein n=1 Tax=Oryzibacter oryziterrae TaxID=2766474 RepID=UPI001F23BB9F|nr:TIGR02301 family protein [Oryzibacter oryziterrae]
MRGLTALLIVLTLAATDARSQTPAPAYQADLLRFSEVVGSVSYLDRLCGGAGGYWRQSMEQLIKAQGLTGGDRRPYVEAFNRGERTFAVVHTICTDRSRDILMRLMGEGEALARRITARFGGEAPTVSPPPPSGLPAN